MCGRYEAHTPVEEIARRFDARLTPEAALLPPRYNIAPTLAVPVVRESSGGRLLEAMTWGLMPSWAKDPSGARPINARAETIFDKPMFRNAIRRRRCLIPADGFYEWHAEPQRKQPYHIGMVDGALFAFAGIWEYWARAPEAAAGHLRDHRHASQRADGADSRAHAGDHRAGRLCAVARSG